MDKIIEFFLNPVFDIGFMGQILLPSIIILLAAPKRKNFVLRLVIFTLIALASAVTIPYRPFESMGVVEPWYSIITAFGYLIHFGVLIVCMYFVFDIKFIECFFCCLMSYNIQHGTYCVSKIFELLFPPYHNLGFLYMGLQWIPNGLIAYFIYRYLITKQGFKIRSTDMFIAISCGILVNIFVSSFAKCDTAESEYVYYFLGTSVIACVALLLLQLFNVSEGAMLQKLEETKIMWNEDRHNYKIQKKVQDEFDMKVHDLKHFIHMFEGQVDPAQIEKMDEILQGRQFINLYETNSLALDVILNMKNQDCLSKGIQFNFSGDGNLLSFMDDNDIYALFGNIIDNSIDAVKNLPKDQRIINLSFFSEIGSLIITNENYFSGNLSYGKNKTLLTTKTHKQGHGYGLASIKYIAKKYKGDVTFHTEGNQFFLTVMIKGNIIK